MDPAQLRAVMVGEAALGEKIMRALILRRVALIESGFDNNAYSRAAASSVPSSENASRSTEPEAATWSCTVKL